MTKKIIVGAIFLVSSMSYANDTFETKRVLKQKSQSQYGTAEISDELYEMNFKGTSLGSKKAIVAMRSKCESLGGYAHFDINRLYDGEVDATCLVQTGYKSE
jgi:hypothetical protein